MAKKQSMQYGDTAKRAKEHESGFVNTSLNRLPEGMKFFAPKDEGTYRLDFFPYQVKGGNPHGKTGQWYPERTYFAHRAIGMDENSYVCLRKTFGKKCPVCEHQAKLKRAANADAQAVKDLEPKERQLWIVKDLSKADGGFMVWDVSFHLFGKQLDAKIKAQDEDDNYHHYFYLEGGKTVKVSLVQKTMGTNKFLDCSSIDFKDRKEDYTVDDLPDLCLDDLLKEVDYDKLHAIFHGESEDGDDAEEEDDTEEEEAPVKKKAKKPVAEEEDDDDGPDLDEDDDEPIPAKKKKAAPADDDDEPAPFAKGDTVKFEYKGKRIVGKVVKIVGELAHVAVEGRENPYVVDFEDLTVVPAGKKLKNSVPADADDEEPAPKKKAKKAPVEEEDEEPELDDDELADLDDEDDEPAPAKKKAKKPVAEDDDEDEVPAKKAKFKPGKTVVEDDDDFELPDDDEEPAPAKKKVKK
jgi:hypothetical protein